MALAKHIQIAQTQGPKAGFNAYLETLTRSGLDTAQASLAEIKGQGNKKAQFDFYCAKFGSKFGSTPVRVDEADELAEQLRVLQTRLAELQGQGVGVVATTEDDEWDDDDTATESVLARLVNQAIGKRSSGRSTTATAPAPAARKAPASKEKENLWRPWAIARFGIPMQVGGKFTYTSARAGKNTVHQVTRVTDEGVFAKRVA